MTTIKKVKGDLFKVAPEGSILLHACNAQGSWGSGIAAEFKHRFPLSYLQYKACCEMDQHLTGTPLICWPENGHKIVCLVTSSGFGFSTDPVSKILSNTERSISLLCDVLGDDVEIYSPAINSGIFSVPWPSTEKIIEGSKFKNWTVCFPDCAP
jgi:ADP-ribose 1''-phosphate phosphatase